MPIKSGIVNIWKPSGITSQKAVNHVRHALNMKRVGHTGTLDPMAEGVLPVCIGKATRAASYITASEKTYRAVLTLGIVTDTQDITGNIISRSDILPSSSQIQNAVSLFKGEIMQTPPMYSAVHHNGKRLYELARNGICVEREKRKITVYSIDIENIKDNEVTLLISCSKGTYIRTLCADIGEYLGCGGTMSYLARTQSGVFTQDNSVTLDDFELDPFKYIIPADKLFEQYDAVILSAADSKKVRNGVSPKTDRTLGDICRLYSESGEFLCISQSVMSDECQNIFKMSVGFYEV